MKRAIRLSVEWQMLSKTVEFGIIFLVLGRLSLSLLITGITTAVQVALLALWIRFRLKERG